MSKSYRQFCGLARALDVVGERWTLLVVRNLLLGPKRYGALLDQLPGITTNLLAKRLREMSDEGLVVRTQLPPPANVAAYELTDAGRALEPAVMALAGWGSRFMDAPRKGDAVDIGWGLLSLKRRYRGGESLAAELRIDDRVFSVEMEATRLSVEERPTSRADLTLGGSTGAFASFFFQGPPTPERARPSGISIVRGDDAVLARFLAAFNAPAARANPTASRPGGTREAGRPRPDPGKPRPRARSGRRPTLDI